ncbi:uncharacterized protein LOC100891868 [Strongylocentrotus purpuratus]|uniref:Protein SPEC3 n=1 Tax=Strongylocentrotus purpuratus TaxID=7668 RepID=A0A7M7PTT0_STRPU|nr:uncharacterized protein LOC100891868 [Strongylocentrotus purpuratus]
MKRNSLSSDKVELLRNISFSHRIDPAVELPNQIPVTSEITKSSAICNATVKWKSRLSTNQAPDSNLLLDAASSPTKRAGASNHQDPREKNPEVVITAVGSQSNVHADDGGLMMKDTKPPDADNLSQNSVWTRQGSIQGSRPDSRHGSRPSSRNSLASGRVASALFAMGTGASFTELPKGGMGTDGQTQVSRVNSVDNPLLAAIPYLPVKLAWIFLLFNILVPGLGTVLAGISMLCCGTRQTTNKQDDEMGLCCTNIFVGVSQLFTVTFLLVGWIWSITWGVYMVVFALEHKKSIDQEMRLKRVTTAAKAFKAGRVI